MVKIAVSAAIRAYIAMRPRGGSFHSISVGASGKDVAFITLAPLLVLPIRIVRMLKIPERTPALDAWDGVEVVCGWRRIRRPLERPRIPRIVSSRFAVETRPNQI